MIDTVINLLSFYDIEILETLAVDRLSFRQIERFGRVLQSFKRTLNAFDFKTNCGLTDFFH